jgi:dTMP kinase
MNQKKLKKGVLIAVEGIDGAGKTTQVRLLKERLCSLSFEAVVFKEPTDGVFGQRIREIAQHGRDGVSAEEEFQLFLKDRVEDVQKNLQPKLDEGCVVIMDRYYFSNIAYQGALGLDAEYIKRENEKIAPVPDAVFILDTPPSIGLNRIKNLRGEMPNIFEEQSYLTRVRNIFNNLAELPYVYIIKGDDSIQKVHEILTKKTMQILNQYS